MNSMKPRHAAALALILALWGCTKPSSERWYLIVPLPRTPDVPMVYWSHYASYDNAKECEQNKASLVQKIERRDYHAPPGEYSAKELRAAYLSSICLVSDDPRLSE